MSLDPVDPSKAAHRRIGKVTIPSYNEILPRLYLGDICTAVNKIEIAHLGITDMITIEIKPLPPADIASTVQRYLYINVMDHQKQDILSHFDTSNQFIETALKTPSNKVYVHCVAGISRSATLVIAYIMKTRAMNYYEAKDLVSQKRKVVDPNEGFIRQLFLYHKMKYVIDFANLEYRQMVLDALVFEFRLVFLSYYQVQNQGTRTGTNPSGQQLPTHSHRHLADKNSVSILFDQYYNKLHLQEVSKYSQIYDPQTAVRCNKCRVVVFYAISVIENKQDQSVTELGPEKPQSNPTSSGQTSIFDLKSMTRIGQRHGGGEKECPYVFVEPQPWMAKNILQRDGNLECYKCKRKLGKFDWTSSANCSCSRHTSNINRNLFKIFKKKLDMVPTPGGN